MRALRVLLATVLALLLLAGCRAGDEAPPSAEPAATPEAAVQRLLADLRRDDLGAYAVHALPPGLYAQVARSWADGGSRWPLSELPLHAHWPAAFDRMAVPGADAALRRGYRQQFAGAHREVDAAVGTLSAFARQMIERDTSRPRHERAHRVQLLQAVSQWAGRARLAEADRVEPLLPPLVAAARAAQLQGGQAAWSRHGLHRTLSRLRPVLRATKRALAALGLDLDAALDGARVTRLSGDGTQARVRLDYRLAGHPVSAELELVRQAEGWFLAESLRHATASLAAGAAGRVGHNAGDVPADPPAVPGRPAPR